MIGTALALIVALQWGATPSSDSVAILTFDAFHRRVASFHPVVRQARLLESMADADVRGARGAFEPVLTFGRDSKTSGGTEYYDYLETAVKIPTPLGIDVKVGYERTQGQYINPDRRTPDAGLAVASVSIPLGQRLLLDDRRNAIRQAQALRELAAGERTAAVNKLLLSAAKAYAAWFEADGRLALAREGVALAEFRLGAVRRRVLNGDNAAIDTVEASLEVARRQVQRLEAENALQNAALAVTGFRWDERGAPAALLPGARPDSAGLGVLRVDQESVRRWGAVAEREHPDVRKARAKVQQSELQRALTGQQLFLPDAGVSVSGIATRGVDDILSQLDGQGGEDYKLSAAIYQPLLLMKARAKYDASGDKRELQRLDLAMVRRDVAIAIRIAANDLAMIDSLLVLQRQAAAQATALRDGEQRKFDNGESTLFLVNARERAVLEEQLRVVALRARYASARAALSVALGQPGILPE